MTTYPCSDDPSEIIEGVVGAGENAEKFDKFVNGSALEEVQLGTGQPTPTLRNVVHLVKSAASTLDGSDVSGKFSDAANGGETLRMLSERFGDIVNVKDFGAAGDGETDDAAAIQDALDFAGTDKCVWFPAGTYLLSETVTGSCDIVGSGVGSSVLKIEAQAQPAAEDASAVYALAWTGDQLQKTIRGLRVDVGNNARGIRYAGSGRVMFNDVYVNLLGAGIGIYIKGNDTTDWRRSVSRLFRFDNVSVLGQGGYETIGVVLINANDSRIVNSEIMGCKNGLDVRTGTGHIFMSDFHIWCGDSSRSSDGTSGNAVWWRSTRCIVFNTICTVTATNLYLDSAKNAVYYKRPIRFFVKNFTYWDAYWQYLSGESGFLWYADELAYVNDQRRADCLDPVETTDSTYVKDNTVISLDGGIVNARFTMHNYSAGSKTFMPNNVYIVRNAPTSSADVAAVTPATEEIEFNDTDLRLPRSYQEKRTEWTVSCAANAYTPVAVSFNQFSGCCRFLLSADSGQADYDIQITGEHTIRCVTNQTAHNLYSSYNSSTGVTTLYYRPPSACTATIKVLLSTNLHYLFVTPLLITRDSYTRYQPEPLDSDSGLSVVDFYAPTFTVQ